MNGTTYYYAYSLVTSYGEGTKSAVVSATPTVVNSTNFALTKTLQTFTVPPRVGWVTVDLAGGSGYQSPSSGSSIGGKGGRIDGFLVTAPSNTYSIYVGGAATGTMTNVGYNGGGVSVDGNGGAGGGCTFPGKTI